MRNRLLSETIEKYDPGPCNREIERFRKMLSLKEAVRSAAESIQENGRYYPHQRRNLGWHRAIPSAVRILVNNCEHFRTCSDFDEVYELLKELLSRVKGLGPLYYYDVSVRIGAFLAQKYGLEEFLPDKVYLHAGPLAAAKWLEYQNLLKGKPKNGVLKMAALPDELQEFEPYHAETILCHLAGNCRNA